MGQPPANPGPDWHEGGCHCGSVRFAVRLGAPVLAHICNCSMCDKVGFVHLIVPERDFALQQGGDHLSTYAFNTGIAQHLFCRVCGVKSFYRPRSNPDGWSVNWRCLDAREDLDTRFEAFDGKNWEANAASLAHLSKS